VLVFGTACSQDDLTYNLANIFKSNKALREDELRGAAAHIFEEHLQLLQYHCVTLIDNDMPGMPQSCHQSGRPFQSIKARLKGKFVFFFFFFSLKEKSLIKFNRKRSSNSWKFNGKTS
jgi:DNA-directed RNA polymerase beta' subunit